MIIEISKQQSMRAIFGFINEELSVDEYHKLIVKLIREYKEWKGADMETLARICARDIHLD
jgi:hypothetical protein